MTLELIDFRDGLCPGIDAKYQRDRIEVGRVQQWIDAGLLFEPHTSQPSALMGWLHLTDKGRAKCGIEAPIVEKQGELF